MPDEQPTGISSALKELRAFLAGFWPGALPALYRRSYRWELTSALLLPTAVACVEGNVVGVLIKKGFIPAVAAAEGRPESDYDLLVAIVAASGPLAMLTSVLWTRLFHARDRVRMINALQLGVLACVFAMALLPVTQAGLLALAGFTLLARSMLTGIITARSDVWRANYPRSDRARVTGRLGMVASLIVATTAIVLSVALDARAILAQWLPRLAGDAGQLLKGLLELGVLWPTDPLDGAQAHRLIYLLAVVLGMFGVWAYSRVRWRGRVAHLDQELASKERLDLPGPRSMLTVLRDDRFYRRFMAAQFLLGAPNLAAMPVFIIGLERIFALPYTPSMVLTQVIPIVLPVVTIPFWAYLLDRMHVVRYRVYQSAFFIVANALTGIGFLTEQLWLIVLARFTLGIAFGGGMLAWQLGHHDFAKRELASVYMGIHVTLTGVRGVIAPFVGVLLYSGVGATIAMVLPASAGADPSRAPEEALGPITFLILAGVGSIATLMFARLSAELRRAGITRGADQ
jgi:hypothetical protein